MYTHTYKCGGDVVSVPDWCSKVPSTNSASPQPVVDYRL